VIYALGLCDYLSDRPGSESCSTGFTIHLSPGDWVVLTNRDAASPDRAFTEHILDWPVMHRTQEQFAGLFARSRFADLSLEISREDAGVKPDCTVAARIKGLADFMKQVLRRKSAWKAEHRKRDRMTRIDVLRSSAFPCALVPAGLALARGRVEHHVIARILVPDLQFDFLMIADAVDGLGVFLRRGHLEAVPARE